MVTAITTRVARAQGFTLVEVMVAASILIVGLLGTFTMVDQAQRTASANTSRTTALALGREIVEHARSLDYAELTPATMVAQLRTKPGIAGRVDADGKWVITRRNFAITVTAGVCTFDDPMDGLSALPPQNPCPAATAVAGTPTETNPDDFRRVSLVMTWKARGRTNQTTQVAQISNPSGGIGPSVPSFPDPFLLQVTTGVSIPFVLTTTAAATVRWSMDDGVSMGDAFGGPTGWNFNWNIGTVGVGSWTVDGTYTANVQPFDSRGVAGARRAATVMLNRRVPLAPGNLQGGRSDANGGVVELEWAANPERDILGYRVYRTGSTNIKARICPPPTAGEQAVTTKVSCTDTDPGPQPLYTLVAVDRPVLGDPSSGTREGESSTLTVGGSGTRPAAPLALTAVVVGGRVSLTWLPGVGALPAFYRIYRDGVRVDRTATDLPAYVDPVALDGTVRRYYVTAVSAQFNESPPSIEVTAG